MLTQLRAFLEQLEFVNRHEIQLSEAELDVLQEILEELELILEL